MDLLLSIPKLLTINPKYFWIGLGVCVVLFFVYRVFRRTPDRVEGMVGYTGLFGAGKTFQMTADAYDMYKKGWVVCSNYKVAFSSVEVKTFEELVELMKYLYLRKQIDPEFKELKVVLLIDEAGIYFSSRRWKEWADYEYLTDFMLQCRKLNVLIFYTVQHPSLVDVNFRRVTMDWILCYAWNFLRIIGVRRQFFLPPDKPSFSDEEVAKNGKLSFFWFGSNEVFNYYDTTDLVSYLSTQDTFNPESDYDFYSKKLVIDSWTNRNLPHFKRWVLWFPKFFSKKRGNPVSKGVSSDNAIISQKLSNDDKKTKNRKDFANISQKLRNPLFKEALNKIKASKKDNNKTNQEKSEETV